MDGYGTRTPGPRRAEVSVWLWAWLPVSFFCAHSPVNPRLHLNPFRWKDVLFTVPLISRSHLLVSSTSL